MTLIEDSEQGQVLIKMKNYFNTILLLLVFFQMGFKQKNSSEKLTHKNIFTNQLPDKKLKLEIKRNYEDSNIVLYLNVNGKITDSMRIDFVDFVTDSLISINDTMWHYIYSFQKIHPDAKLAQQMVITEKNNKIHLAYASDYIYYVWEECHLNDSFFYNNPSVMQYIHSSDGYLLRENYDTLKKKIFKDTIPNGEYIISLKYDAAKKVYYQQEEYLTAPFSVSGKYLKTNSRFDNEKVLSIKFTNTKMIFWDNKWFQCNEHYYDYGIKYNLIPFEETYRWRYL